MWSVSLWRAAVVVVGEMDVDNSSESVDNDRFYRDRAEVEMSSKPDSLKRAIEEVCNGRVYAKLSQARHTYGSWRGIFDCLRPRQGRRRCRRRGRSHWMGARSRASGDCS